MDQKNVTLALGTGNVWKLLLQYAIPSIIAMTAASLYNIIDSVFIGHGVGSLAISGLAITFPLMNLSAAFGAMVGVGSATLMSLRLGQKDYAMANNILGNVFTLNLILGLSYTVLIMLFLDPILIFFGASNVTLPYAHEYMMVILYGNVITHMYLGFNALLRAIGHPQKSMYLMLGSVLMNAVLTPFFIYSFGWGIKGAAWATIISQTIMLAWQMRFFSNKSSFIHFTKGTFRLRKKIVSDALAIGLSPFLMNSVSCVIVIIINQGLIKYGSDLHVGAYGIINRVIFLFAMIVMGMNQGMQPIVGYNFGAKQTERVSKVLKYTLILATGVMTLGFIISEFLPTMVAAAFTNDQTLNELASTGLRLVALCLPLVGIQLVSVNFFQSIGMARLSIFMSLTRQVIFLIPGLIIIPRFIGVDGIWYSFPIADLLACLVAVYMLMVEYKKIMLKHSL